MDFSHYSDVSVSMAVDLVNTLDVVSGEDRMSSVEDLEAFLAAYGKDWDAEDWCCDDPRTKDLAAVVEIRERLREVFDAEDAVHTADLLNEILSDSAARPRISVHGPGPHMHFEPDNSHVAGWLGATTAMGLAVVLVDHGLERFGVCGAEDCQDVYVDTSKNRSRNHCSTSCTTRANVAAYRQRQRESTA